MKELSIEEKAKRYDKAIERAKAYQGLRSEMEIIFPELKESEDERILLTKYLQKEIDCLRCDIRDYKNLAKLDYLQRALAWLEKQGRSNKE